LLLEDWQHAHLRLADTEARMLAVLDDLQLSELVTSITGVSALGTAAILAQTGDPRRFNTPASPRGRSCPARSSAGPSSPDKAPRTAPRGLAHGVGRRNAPTPSTPPDTAT
jgi:hypothetical protein